LNQEKIKVLSKGKDLAQEKRGFAGRQTFSQKMIIVLSNDRSLTKKK
jgi:hypothetical protein